MTMLTLPDGRLLDVLITGPDNGFPLLSHHGTPGSLLQMRAMQRAAHAHDLRLITYSRAGFGNSTRRPGRSVANAAEDTAAILDHIGADRAFITGASGGGPHALACAALLPDRVAGVLVVAGVGPYGVADLDFLAGMGKENVDDFTRALRGEDAIRPHYENTLRPVLASGDVPTIINGLTTLLPDVDRAVFTDELGEDIAASFAEGLRSGVDGWVDDDLAFTRPWGFDPADIVVPSFVWQGTEDLMVPFTHGQWLAKHIPGATTHLEQGEGHLSIAVGKLDTMLDELVAIR